MCQSTPHARIRTITPTPTEFFELERQLMAEAVADQICARGLTFADVVDGCEWEPLADAIAQQENQARRSEDLLLPGDDDPMPVRLAVAAGLPPAPQALFFKLQQYEAFAKEYETTAAFLVGLELGRRDRGDQ